MGGQAKVYKFPNADALATALRRYVIQAQLQGFTRHGKFQVAVSGGSVPKTLARALLKRGDGPDDTVEWKKWEIFLADERAVTADDADSNYGLIKAELLDRIPKAEQPRVHPIDAAYLDDTQELADQYEQALVSSFASRDSVRLPIFDLILLGCGPDGHTCSLFPGHPLLRETSAWVAGIDDSPKPPSRRITLTLPVVTHANRVAFVATGQSKRDVLRTILDDANGSNNLPAGVVSDAAGDRCSWFVDSPAVEGLSFPTHTFT